ncbi:hypothetical protein F4808DRAFT_106198 [Astrocystis sublimbata]|nr:hypothetical protein F4808DRAFT_106198 [Astrocystis sublimbata]
MDRYLGQLWTPSTGKPEGKRPKRKLQKSATLPPEQVQQHRRPYSISYSDTKMEPQSRSHRKSLSFNIFNSVKPTTPQRPTLPQPIKSDDGKWLEDFRKNGYLYRDSRRSRAPTENEKTDTRTTTPVVPEFAHLNVYTPPPEDRKPSPPSSQVSRQPTSRRYAKTPVSQVGQLETHPLLRTHNTAQDVPTIESIAESYRALLDSRTSMRSEAVVDHAATAEKHGKFYPSHDQSLVPPPLERVTEIPEPAMSKGSTRSDDGTLVDDGSVDYRHASMSTSPTTPSYTSWETAPLHIERNTTAPARGPDLGVCVDLLATELSSAMRKSPAQPSADSSALQIWVMIEAYERLREQTLSKQEENGQESPLRGTFDTWLRALYAVHDEMIGDDSRSESNYGD